MANKRVLKLEGFRELDAALGELPKATGKNVMRRGMLKALEPMEHIAEARAPYKTGRLQKGIEKGTRLSRAQAREARETKSYVEVYMGPRPGVVPIVAEFGSYKDSPQPYMRPAWDEDHAALLERMKAFTWGEIRTAAQRLARKAARLTKGL